MGGELNFYVVGSQRLILYKTRNSKMMFYFRYKIGVFLGCRML